MSNPDPIAHLRAVKPSTDPAENAQRVAEVLRVLKDAAEQARQAEAVSKAAAAAAARLGVPWRIIATTAGLPVATAHRRWKRPTGGRRAKQP